MLSADASELWEFFFQNNGLYLLLFVGVFWVVWISNSGDAIFVSKRKDLWSPPGVPILGHALQLTQKRDLELWYDIRTQFRAAVDKHEPKALSLTVPGFRIIDVAKPQWLEHIQKTNAGNYQKIKQLREAADELLGNALFLSHGERRARLRQTVTKLFTPKSLRNMLNSQSLYQDHIWSLVAAIEKQDGTPFDFQKLMMSFTLIVFCSCAFGKTVGEISTDPDYNFPFNDAIATVQATVLARCLNPLWKLSEHLNGSRAKWNDAVSEINRVIYSAIRERRMERTTAHSVKRNDFLDQLLDQTWENGTPFDDDLIRDSICHLIIAARDTTGQWISWTMWRLIQSKSTLAPFDKDTTYDAATKEIDQVIVGTYNPQAAIGDGIPLIGYDDYTELPIVLAALWETVRLHPTGTRLNLQAMGPDVLPHGPRVEKGDILFWSNWNMGRDSELWGADARDWLPSRWIQTNESGMRSLVKQDQWKAHFFGGGTRSCLGRTFSTFEAVSVLSTLLKRFDFKFHDLEKTEWLPSCAASGSAPEPDYLTSVSLPMASGCMVVATLRNLE